MNSHQAIRLPADICRELGWTVGTRLTSMDDEQIAIEITAMDENKVFAKVIDHSGKEDLSRRKSESSNDSEERIAARYRSELAAETKLREAAEKLSHDSNERANQAEKELKALTDKLASTMELLGQERSRRENGEHQEHIRTAEIKSLHENLSRFQAMSKSLETLLPIVHSHGESLRSLPSTIDERSLRPILGEITAQLKSLQETVKVPRETLHLPVKEPMPSFDFKPTYGQYGQIVGIRATPVKTSHIMDS